MCVSVCVGEGVCLKKSMCAVVETVFTLLRERRREGAQGEGVGRKRKVKEWGGTGKVMEWGRKGEVKWGGG